MEMMNGTIDKISKDRVEEGKTPNLEWSDEWVDTWQQNGNIAELSRYCVGLRAILENEETFKTIGEMYGITRPQMIKYEVSLPKPGEEAADVLKLFNLGKKNCALFLLLMCPVSVPDACVYWLHSLCYT